MAMGMRAQQAFLSDRRASVLSVRTSSVCTRVLAPRSTANKSAVICQAAATAAPPVFKGDLLNKSYYPTLADTDASKKQWYIIDAEGQTLGRLATLAATYIRGKHLPTYTPSMDMGAYVVVINAEKVVVSGRKGQQKKYFNHINGRPGSYRLETFDSLQARIPERILERAVKGMLPKGAIGRRIRLHLKVFKGDSHDHTAQKPIDITKEINVKPSKSPIAIKNMADLKA